MANFLKKNETKYLVIEKKICLIKHKRKKNKKKRLNCMLNFWVAAGSEKVGELRSIEGANRHFSASYWLLGGIR